MGYLETMSKLWHLSAMDNSSNAPISKWVTRDQRDNVSHLYLHCVGIRVSEQLEKLLWRKVPYVLITSATLRSLNSFERLQEMSNLNEQAGNRFMTLASPFNHVAQGKITIPQMRFEPIISTEAQHLEEMARFFHAEQASGQQQDILTCSVATGRCRLFLATWPICA